MAVMVRAGRIAGAVLFGAGVTALAVLFAWLVMKAGER